MSTTAPAEGDVRLAAGTAAVPEAVAPPPGHPRFPLMDSLRAIAALGVLFGHVSINSEVASRHWWGAAAANLDAGVTVFFVLSGFLLYRPFVNSEATGARRPGLAEFARRRVLRIVPAYWLALSILALYPGLPGVWTGDWWRYYGLLQFYDHRTYMHGPAVAWTLSVEVAFYALLPFYAALTRRVPRGRTRGGWRVQLGLLAALAAASLVLSVADQDVLMQKSLLTHFYWFALGMGLAVLSVAYGDSARVPWARLVAARPLACWGGALVVYLVMSAGLTGAPQHLLYSVPRELWKQLLSGVVAVLLVLPAVFGAEAGGLPRRVLAWRWLAWLGLVSYGIYLWHQGISAALGLHGQRSFFVLLPVVLAGAVVCAAVSYVVVERPLLRLKRSR